MNLLFNAFNFSKLFVIVCRILSQMVLLIFFSLFYISNLENKKFEIKKVLLINKEYFIINQMLFKMTFTLHNLLKIVQISIILKFI